MKAQKILRLTLIPVFFFLVVSPIYAFPPQRNNIDQGNITTSAANARWFLNEVDTQGDTGLHTAIAFEPYDDVPYISYYDESADDLLMALYMGNGQGNCIDDNDWFCYKMDSTDQVGMYNAIAFDPTHTFRLGISYYDATYAALKYIDFSKNIAPWKIFYIDIGTPGVSYTGLFTSLAFDSSGTPYIAYHRSRPGGTDDLVVAHYTGSSGNCGYGTQAGKWQCDTILTGDGAGQYTSLAVDGSNNVHIAFYAAGGGDLWYATNSIGSNCGPGGNTWTCYAIDSENDVGKYASLYVDSAGNFHIAYYYAETNGKLMYAHRVSGSGNCGVIGSAKCEVIDDMQSKYFSNPKGISIIEDAAGYPIIAYQSEYGDLNVARPLGALGLPLEYGNCGPIKYLYPSWYCQTVHPHPTWGTVRHGDFISIATNSAGLANIAYYEFITTSKGNLGVARQFFEVFQPVLLNK